MILDIIKYGDINYNKLRAKNVDVKKENPFLKDLINNMFITLNYYNGIGLAAPQVGHNLNLFVIDTGKFREVFINPKIKLSGLAKQSYEGCLSVPGMTLPTNRFEKVSVQFYDQNWTYRYGDYSDDIAIIIQHEYDHLKGKLITD